MTPTAPIKVMRRVVLPAILALALTGWLAASPETGDGADRASAGSPLLGLEAAYRAPPSAWPPARVEPGVDFAELAALPPLPAPDTDGRRKAELGRALFHDPLLSAGGDLACADCHDPRRGWSGAPSGPAARKAPSVASSARRSAWSWDGRHETLASQLLAPLTDPAEMANASLEAVTERLAARNRFASAFGPGGVTAPELAEALRAFVAGLDEPSRFDRFAAGEHEALSAREIRGLHLFRTRAGCANCHHGPLLTDGRDHNLGLSALGEPGQDLGRSEWTGRPSDAGRFRTPSLRHVSRTAPYMHDGSFASLEGIVRFYERGGGEVWIRNEEEARNEIRRAAAETSRLLRHFALTPSERAALVAFLEAL